jgi:hypothetical protein
MSDVVTSVPSGTRRTPCRGATIRTNRRGGVACRISERTSRCIGNPGIYLPNSHRVTNFSRGCSINRYYDPATGQFLSIDPAVAVTKQPFIFANDNPLNATDPLGLKGWYCISGVSEYFSGNKYGVTGTGKCKTKTVLNSPSPPMPSTPTTSANAPIPVASAQAANPPRNSAPTAAQTQAVNNYISDTQKPWCYAGVVIGSGGSLGMTGMVTVSSGVLADGPPAWVIAVAGGITVTAIIYTIKLALSC